MPDIICFYYVIYRINCKNLLVLFIYIYNIIVNIVNNLSYKTISGTKISFKKKWVLIDATNKSIGRLVSFVSQILRGKHKILFTSHINCGDYVIIINADKISIKGNNWKKRKYIRYTGFPGGQLIRSSNEQWLKNPCKIFKHSIKGMLPKNKLGAKIYKNLFVYSGSFHEHEAQKPIIINYVFN